MPLNDFFRSIVRIVVSDETIEEKLNRQIKIAEIRNRVIRNLKDELGVEGEFDEIQQLVADNEIESILRREGLLD